MRRAALSDREQARRLPVSSRGEFELRQLANCVQNEYAASFSQHRMWFLDRLDSGHGTAYVTTPMWRVHGPLDRARLQAALDTVVARHDVLRAVFRESDGTPRVVLTPSVDLTIDWRDATSADEIARQADAEADRPFDLTTGPLLRVVAWRLTDTEHVLLAAMHHIVSDGWSVGLLARELAAAYAGEPLPDLPVRYVDFAQSQRRELDGDRLAADLDHWRRQLAGLPALTLPTDRPRPEHPSHAAATTEFVLGPDLVAGLHRLGREHGVTLYMTLLAAFQVLLSRWSGQRDFGIGSPVAGRNSPEVENLIGLFVNTVVLRARLAGDPTFAELLARVRDDALDALDHQEVPYERVVQELRPDRPDTDSLIDAWFAMQNVPGDGPSAGPLRFTDFEVDRPKALFAVSLFAQPRGDELAMTVVYRSDLFDAATIDRLARRCRELLAAVVADPGIRVGAVELPADETAALRRFGAAEVTGRVVDPVDALTDRVRRDGAAAAALTGDATVSYAELNARANRVAWWLRERGVGPERPVGIRLPRGVDMLAAVLGVLKAGGAYVPLDPAWPAERVDVVRADAGLDILLDGPLPDGGRDDDLQVAVDPAQLAYVIYTSGSTGRPKGVGVSRGAMAAHVSRMRRRFGLGPDDRVLQFAALAFDASIDQIFPALSSGAALVLPEHGLVAPATLLPLLDRHGVTLVNLPPAYFGQLVAELTERGGTGPRALRTVVLGGDVVRPADVDRFGTCCPDVAVLNAYGPTETTVTTTVAEVPRGLTGAVPIGRALADRDLYVLDAALRDVPVGAVGELFVGGTQLARGYLGRPGLTGERFVPDPFGRTPGGRLYRTGDLVRWRPDGQVEFHGRADGQVKVRGFRVEIGEVEARLREHPGVRDAVVVAGQDRLVAYLAGAGVTGAQVRERLAQRLPEFMVPAVVVVLDELPRTVGGKVDRDRLPDPEGHRPEVTDGFAEPRTPTEETIADVWRQVLRVDRIGVHDNFFDLGGHSLLATLAVARLVKALDRPVDVRSFFAHPTIAEFAAALPPAAADPASAPASAITRLRRSGDFPLSFAQERMWFLNRLEPDAPDYMAALAWRVDGPLDRSRLDRALRQLVDRHESLRTTFPVVGTSPTQRVAAAGEVTADWHDVTATVDPYATAVARAGAELHRPFDLAAGPLFRALVWRLGPEDHLLVLAMHHIVSDGWSMGVLVRELGAAYAGEALPELPVQYADYAGWQRRELTGDRLDAELGHWRERLAGLPALELPTDRPRPAHPSWAGATHEFTLDPELVAGLERLGRRHGATLYMTLLAAFQALLSRWTGQDDFGVGVPVAGRTRPEVENVIGFFVNTLVMRADTGGDPTFAELLGRVRDRALDAYQYQELPFERVVEELRPDRESGRSPLFQVMFDLEARAIAAPRLGAARLRPAEIPFDVTKFDLMVTFTTEPGAAGGFVQYRTDLFDAATIDRLVRRCQELLAVVAAAPDTRIGATALPATETALLRRFGAAETPGRVTDPVVAFEGRARRDPGALAAIAADGVLSYAELNARANRVAWGLRERGVRAETPVVVRLPRGVDMLAAVLGVLKAGGAYVPVDPAWPAERADLVTADVGASVVLDGPLPDGGRDDDLQVAVDPAQLAYVIYTSGSTGRPKGVGVSRGAMAAHVSRMRRRFGLGPDDRVLQFAALAFDASIEQIFPALSCGAALVLPEHGLVAPAQIVADVERHRVTVMEVVPGYLTELIAEVTGDGTTAPTWSPARLRLLVLGGDAVRPADLAWWRRHHPDVSVVNTYGPTETTISATVYDVPADVDGVVPIGRAVGDRALYVLDGDLAEVPVGAVGELFVGGTQLARGYLGRPGLTAERFVPDPYGPEPGGRLYRTGDLVRWRADGQVEFHGRADGQVKVRGFRVEVGEVEARLREHPGVRDAVVVAWQDRLVAYLTGAGVTVDELRDRLAQRLPGFMVPAVLIVLDELPRTVGGKVDRDRLPDPAGHRPAPAADAEPPRTPTEETVADIWRQVLRVDRIGIHDNFFHLGGHSLLATRVAIRLRAAFGCEVAVRTLFEEPTVARLAAAVEDRLMAEIAAMSSEDVEQALKEQNL
ncbi:non-ribosomal peptide synthetase [Micromonospora sp. WMMD998]|uniref:non-ribosomal peptide synthetase n=1 Tax=Micromonospora sp. WMMD998 TaxID=3016092 RepID=UPI00249A85AA|nr:non-ribosomal peptide synthetase [Micromonospora sp. WMMD998]WFE40907.1 amino acid adenylation domain-containing protein [Micromonospora sp. WMMD998]